MWKRHLRDRVTLRILFTRWSRSRPCHSLSHSLDTTWHAEWERGQFDAWVDLSGNVHERIDRGHNWRRSLSSLWDTLLTIHKMNQHLDQKLDASRCILSNILSFSLLNPWRYLTSSAASRKITNRFKSRYVLETWVTCSCSCLFCLVINCSLQRLKSHYSYRVEINYKVKYDMEGCHTS